MEEKKNSKETWNCPNCGAAAGPDSVSCTYCGSFIATRICPGCFGNVPIAMKQCTFCGTVLPDSQDADSESPFDCPLCKTKLSLVRTGEYELHECVRCGGVWVEKIAFRNICRMAEEQEAFIRFGTGRNPGHSEASGERSRAYIPCPGCGKLMNHKSFSRGSGIVLDWCRDHGTWLDRQELQQIFSYIRSGGLQMSREHEQRDLEEEKARLRLKQFEIETRANRMGNVGNSTPSLDNAGDSILQFLAETVFK